MGARTIWFCLAVAAAAMACSPAVASAPDDRWLESDATVRRVVTCKPCDTGLPGDEVAVAMFFTGGLAAADGKDVRVYAADESQPRLVPHRVLMVGPGDQLRVAFATVKGVERYHVYYGNAKAEPPAQTLAIRRGLLYEVRLGDASGSGSLKEITRAFDRAGPQGAAFVDNIFFGFNPFGPTEGYISHFTGYLKIEKPGEYLVATTSDDCSFVLIDDQEVVSWPGVHGAVGDARHNKPVTMSRGLHKVDYWHSQGGGDAVAELAWQPPGQGRFVVVPKEAFTPVAFAEPAGLLVKGRKINPDFTANRAGEAFYDGFYAVRLTFDNLSQPADARNVGYQWDFGDGQTSTEKAPNHVYLRHGTYKVRLVMTWGPQSAEVTNRVVVERNWWRQSANQVEPPGPYARQVAGYDLEKLDAESLGHAADLFRAARNVKEQVRTLGVLVFKTRNVPAQQMFDKAVELAELRREAGQYDEAVKAYDRAESLLAAPKQKAAILLAAGRVLLEDLNRPAEAEQRFRRVIKDLSGAGRMVVREAQIGLGDVACRRGDRQAAVAAFAEAEKVPLGGLAASNPTLRLSSLARYVDEYTRTKDFDTAEEFLQTWYREFPSHRFVGDVVVLEARLRFAQERYDRVLRLTNDLVGVNRDSPHAAEALLLAAEAAVKLDRKDEARRNLAQIVDDYPESPSRKAASELLEKLGGRLDGAKGP